MLRRLLVLSAFLAFAGCGDDDTTPAAKPAARATPSPPAGTPFPDAVGGTLHAGTTYTTRIFSPHLRITPAPGRWNAEIGQLKDDFSVAKDGIPGQALLAFHRVRRVFDPVRGGRTPGDMVAAPDDFAAWLEEHPHLKAGPAKRVERLGLEGVRIDVRAVSRPQRVPDDCGRFGGRCVPVLYDGTDVISYTYGSVKARVRFYVLELDGGEQLVVEEYFDSPSAFRRQHRSLDRTLARATTA